MTEKEILEFIEKYEPIFFNEDLSKQSRLKFKIIQHSLKYVIILLLAIFFFLYDKEFFTHILFLFMILFHILDSFIINFHQKESVRLQEHLAELFPAIKSLISNNIENFENELEEHQKMISYREDSVSFSSHSFKNAIIALESQIHTLDLQNVTKENITELQTGLDNIREVVDNFEKFGLHDTENGFKLGRLLDVVEMLHTHQAKYVKAKFEINRTQINENQFVPYPFFDFYQVFDNLLRNAYEAVKDSEIRKVKIDIKAIEKGLIFHISDTGVGIPKNVQNHIFEYQFTTKPKNEKNGVGLFHVRFLAQKNNSEISYIGQKNEFNTVFELQLITKK